MLPVAALLVIITLILCLLSFVPSWNGPYLLAVSVLLLGIQLLTVVWK